MFARRFPILVLLALLGPAASASAQTAPLAKRSDYFGCWLTAKAEPVLIDKGTGGTVIRQSMLLFIWPAEDAEYLVRCRFLEWPPDESFLIGPEAGEGLYDPTTGHLLLGGPSQGVNTVQLLPDGRLLYLHAKSMPDKGVMSVRFLKRVDEAAARDLEKRLIENQQLKSTPTVPPAGGKPDGSPQEK